MHRCVTYTPTHASTHTHIPAYSHLHACTHSYTPTHVHSHTCPHCGSAGPTPAGSPHTPRAAQPRPAELRLRGRGPAALTGHSVMCLEMDDPAVTAPGGTPTSQCCPSGPRTRHWAGAGLGSGGGLSLKGRRPSARAAASLLSLVSLRLLCDPRPLPPEGQGTCPGQPRASAAGGPASAGMCAVTFGGLLLNQAQAATQEGE